MQMNQIHDTAIVEIGAKIGGGVKIWHYAHVREKSTIGDNVILGRGVYVGEGVRIGSECKIQNYALLYEPAVLESGVFVGPGVVLTNDQFPRAVNADGSQKNESDWQPVGVLIREGASIGAQSVCIAPVEIGAWALVAAGSVVSKNVPAFALVAGVPAKRINWVGKAGLPLVDNGNGNFSCPKTGVRYVEHDKDTLLELSL
jgi:UDP-2-acetamido-3-amino-2,3-dideoxy-glucuronate N-acetyltransferase